MSDEILGRSFIRRGRTLAPADDKSLEYLQRSKEGREEVWERRRVRSTKNLRHAFALWRLALELLSPDDRWQTVDEFRWMLALRLGYRTPIQMPDGTTTYIPRSIAFANMPEDEFIAYKQGAIEIIAVELLFCDVAEFVAMLDERTRRNDQT